MQPKKIYNLILLCFFILNSQNLFANEDNIITNILEIFGKNFSNDGQITICSDNFLYKKNMHEIIYKGNVIAIQTKDAIIQCGNENSISIDKSTNWPIYNILCWGKDNYSHFQKESLNYVKDICKKHNGCRVLTGQMLTILLDDQDKKVLDVILTVSSSEEADVSTLYFLQEKNVNQKEIYAEAKQINFDIANNTVILQNKAYISDNLGNTFSGSSIIYDIENYSVIVPDAGYLSTINLKNYKDSKKTFLN